MEQNELPEKLDINKLITIENDIEQILHGKKTSVRRNDRYADKGDEITLHGVVYVVEEVFPQELKNITEQDARDEGYEDIEDYKNALTSIHKEAVWDPEHTVWAHYIKRK